MAVRTLPDQAYLREAFDYDPNAGTLIWRFRPRHHFITTANWRMVNAKCQGKEACYPGTESRGHRTMIVSICGDDFPAGRIIWKYMHNEEPPFVDHDDRDTSNNKIANLRPANRAQNRANSLANKGRSLPKGVYLNDKGRYRAQARSAGQTHSLGTFDTPEEAHAAYCEAATRLHGEFANFGEDRQRTSP